MRWKETEYTGWGRVLKARGEIARPERASALAELIRVSAAPAIGRLRSYGDACLNSNGRAIDMTRLDRAVSFDPETNLAEVEAGMMIGQMLEMFAPMGWLPPVMPGTGFATVGGAVAMDVHGKNHHVAGSFGCNVEAITLMTPDGPKRISTSRNKELFRATIGGMGQTGPILSASVKMKKAKGDVIVVTERRVTDWDHFIQLLDKSDATYSVGWIDATAHGASLGRGVLEEAETGGGLVPAVKRGKKIPFDAPAFTLSPPVVRTFNSVYWRRVPDRGRTIVKPIHDFFFPLDKIHDWNRLYGKDGFHQFQCVVPIAAVDVLREMLARIASSGLASPLAVLKRMGAGRAGYMSFPMGGYTLAVDFPNRPAAERLIRDLESMTAETGGRIYLAKDSLSRPENIAAMYPEHKQWLKAVTKFDPDGKYKTDLVRRLKLREIRS